MLGKFRDLSLSHRAWNAVTLFQSSLLIWTHELKNFWSLRAGNDGSIASDSLLRSGSSGCSNKNRDLQTLKVVRGFPHRRNRTFAMEKYSARHRRSLTP